MTENHSPIVVFDAAGTLIRPAAVAVETYFEFGRRAGSLVTRDQIALRFSEARERLFTGDHQSSQEMRSSETIEATLWRQLVHFVFDDLNDSERLFRELWAYYARPNAWVLFDDVKLCLTQLDSAKHPWIVASNFDRRLRVICRELLNISSENQIFCSSEIGWRKPHIKFFQSIQKTLSRSAGEFLMIGDHPVDDVKGARRAGWQARLLDRSRQQLGQPLAIHSLGEISQHLE